MLYIEHELCMPDSDHRSWVLHQDKGPDLLELIMWQREVELLATNKQIHKQVISDGANCNEINGIERYDRD